MTRRNRRVALGIAAAALLAAGVFGLYQRAYPVDPDWGNLGPCVEERYLHGRPRDTMPPYVLYGSAAVTLGERTWMLLEVRENLDLGRVILEGPAIPNTGIPGNIGGYTAQRVIHAPASGPMVFVPDEKGTAIDIGAIVTEGQIIARVGDTPVYASLTGVLRGLIREGYPVTKGLKIADIDPRLEQTSCCDTVSDKARSIGGGVVEALLLLAGQKDISLL